MSGALPPVVENAAAHGQRRAADPAASVWVAASAGTGKTSVLTNRVLALLLDGTAPERILALTFTKAAAAEMAARIADKLGTWTDLAEGELNAALAELLGHAPDKVETMRARTLFARVLDAPGGMPIQTIHAFCQSLLRRFPLEAGIAPHFSVMDERDAEEMLAHAREDVLARARMDENGGLRAALAAVTRHVGEDGFADLMAALAAARARMARMFEAFGSASAAVAAPRRALGLEADETADSILAAACADAAFDGAALKRAAAALVDAKNSDQTRGAVIAAWVAGSPDERRATFGDYADAFLTFPSGEPPAIRKRLATKDAQKNDPAVLDTLTGEAERLLRAVFGRRAAETAEATAGLLTLAAALNESYAHAKRARALLDYDDLIHAARRLLAVQGDASWVLYKLDGGIDHILIDEAQDTNPEQWQVVAALAAEFFAGVGAHEAQAQIRAPRTMFAVGDVKQSIYAFQGADPNAFLAMREMFKDKAAAARRDWRAVDLTVSFRSVRAVLDAVDLTFARAEAADGVALDGAAIRHEAFRAGQAGLVEVWPPVAPKPADDLPAWKPPVERLSGDSPPVRLAQLIARRIARMIREGEMLPARGRPIRAGDVMVLVRRRTSFVDALVRALKDLYIPVVGADRLVLTEHIAVMDLMALGRFLLLPEDDLTLATVLKSPLLGLSEDDLFRLAWDRADAGRSGSLWRALTAKARDDETFRRAHDALAELLKRVDFVAPFELYAEILGPRRGREKLRARLGPDADDPITVFLDLALAFERGHAPSLEGFLHWLESGAVEVKRDMEHGLRDAVRVITVHGAKGLQAPVVFLPDTLQMPRAAPAFYWVAPDAAKNKLPHEVLLWPPGRAFHESVAEGLRDQAAMAQGREYRRLLYVAMTRAEDRLYVCGWETKKAAPEGNWHELVRAGLEGKAQPIEDEFLRKEKATANATVLRLDSSQEAEPKPDKEAAVAAASDGALPDWARTPPGPEPSPPRALTPSKPAGAEPASLSPLGSDQGRRFRRGTLIHRLLQHLPNLAPDKRPEAARRWLAFAAADIPEALRVAYAAEALAVVGDPRFAHLFGPGSRAEAPVSGVVGGAVVAGQVDRLVVEPGRISILDYKTHRPAPALESDVPEIYLRQMAIYRALLAVAFPGRAVTCALLWTETPEIMELSGAILDRFAPESAAQSGGK